MKKMLKILIMLLVIVSVVFAAGCADKSETAGNETQGDSDQVLPATPETPNMTGENVTENYTQDEAPEGYTGVSGTHTWTIEAVDQGSQQVSGIYKQPWMNTTGTEDNFTLTVEVI